MKPTVARIESTEDTFTLTLQKELDAALAPLNARADVVILSGNNARRVRLQAAAPAGDDYFLIAAMGHGNEESFSVAAPTTMKVFSVSFKAPEVKGAIVHILSCNCAVKLGPALVAKQKAEAFIGYRDYFSGPKDLTLLKHYVAQTAAINLALVAGEDANEVWAAARAAHAQARARLQAEPAATCYDLAAFDANEEYLVGPWTDAIYGHISAAPAENTTAFFKSSKPARAS